MANLSRYQRGFGRRKPGAWARVDGTHPIADGMIGCWLFNESRTTRNLIPNKVSIGNGQSSPVRAVSSFSGNTCTSLTASSFQYYQAVSVDVSAVPITFLVWFNSTSTSVEYVLAALGSSTSVDCFRLGLNTTSARVVARASMTGTDGTATTTASFVVNTWNQAVGVFTSATSRTVYLNGSNSVTDTTSVTPVSGNLNRTTVGALVTSGSATLYLTGKIDHAIFWNRALLPDEILKLYQEPFCFLQQAPSKLSFSQYINQGSGNTFLWGA